MTITIQSTNASASASAGTVNMANGDELFVLAGVNVINSNSSVGASAAVSLAGSATIDDRGTLIGAENGLFEAGSGVETLSLVVYGSLIGGANAGVNSGNASGGALSVTVASGGSIDGAYVGIYSQIATQIVVNGQVQSAIGIECLDSGSDFLYVGAQGNVVSNSSSAGNDGVILNDASFIVENYGAILCASPVGANAGAGLLAESSGDIYNFGTISGLGIGVLGAAVTGDTLILDNFGSITGAKSFSGGAETDLISNQGTMTGAVQLGAGAESELDSTNGVVVGTITCGAGGDVVIGGNNGGLILGGAGNDVLYANTTQAAVAKAAKTTIDGGTGTNWEYGDGAATTFLSGDNAAGGYNLIYGGVSQMAGGSGYANNTVSYASISSAYKSAYIDLKDGYTYMCTTASAVGASAFNYVFEDYLQNTPNIIGTSGSDVIICDNGVDKITSGANKGGDLFYAGAGAGSQDTFAFTSLSQSPITAPDEIVGFKIGTDKIDLSALNLPPADFGIVYGGAGAPNYSTILIEKTPSTGFNSATDMYITVNTTSNAALTFKDLII